MYPLVPLSPNILNNTLEIVLGTTVPLPLYLKCVLPFGLSYLGPLPYPIIIGGEPAYLDLGGRKCVPGLPCLILVPIHILTYISNLIDDPSGGLGPGVENFLPRLSHHTLDLIDPIYEQLGPVARFVPSPLGLPMPMPKIRPPPQQGTDTPLQLHVHQLPLPLDLLHRPLCARFAALGLVGGVYRS